MKVGERALFKIKSEYAYGDSATGKIPAKATLNFEVELLSFQEKEKSKSDFSATERLEKAKLLKELGNKAFKENNLDEAKK
jgi:hypothetical protein